MPTAPLLPAPSPPYGALRTPAPQGTRSGRSSSALGAGEISRVIEMAWEDRTPFEDIHREYGLAEADVIALMRRTLKPSSFRMWRKRVAGRLTKHRALHSARSTAGAADAIGT